jgi:hypothetical protein
MAVLLEVMKVMKVMEGLRRRRGEQATNQQPTARVKKQPVLRDEGIKR